MAASTSRVVNFDNAPVGRTPSGWVFPAAGRGSSPHWEIRRDQTAPTQPHVLAIVPNGEPAVRPPLALFEGVALRDGDVSVRIKPVGKDGHAAGVVWRYRDENNYYLARANPVDNNVVVYKVQDGVVHALGRSMKHEIALNAWCILRVWARGDRYQIFVDHRRVLQGQDATFRGAGMVGLWTLSDSATYFDDFRVNPK